MKKRARYPAKISGPVLPPIIDRQRLFRNLDLALSRPVVWIRGRPGAGKTTLVASYLRNRHRASVWYQLDKGDGDIATLFHYLGLASQKAAPRFKTPLPHLTPEYLLDLPTFTRRFFEKFYERLSPASTLVLDNYHEVPLTSNLHEVLEVGLSQIPDGIRIIIVSRTSPPPTFARLQATQIIASFDEDALALQTDESQTIVRLHAGAKGWHPTSIQLAQLHNKANGWMAGLILLLQQGKDFMSTPHEASASPEAVFAYLANEVMKQLRPEIQEFLTRVVYLPTVSNQLAERLTGQVQSRAFLSELYETRCFIERRQEEEWVYQFHPLFRDFLITRAQATMTQEQLTELQLRAGRVLDEAGHIEEAIGVLQQAGRVDEQIALILTSAPVLLSQGRSQTVEEWITKLPGNVLSHQPWLLFWLAHCRFASNPRAAQPLFEQAFTGLQAYKDQTGVLLSWCGIIDSTLFSWEDLRRLDPWIDRFPTLLPVEGLPTLRAEVQNMVVYSVATGLMWRRTFTSEAAEWMERLEDVLMVTEPNQAAFIGHHLLSYYTWMGQITKADLAMERLHARVQHAPLLPLARINYLLTQSIYAWHSGEPELAKSCVLEGREVGKASGIRIFDFPLMVVQVWILKYIGDLQAAETLLEEIKAHPQFSQCFASAFYHYLASQVFMLKGDTGSAWSHIERASAFSTVVGCPFWKTKWHFEMAEQLLERGDLQEAARHLNQIDESNALPMSHMWNFEFLSMRAHHAFEVGDEDGGTQALRAAMHVGRIERLVDFPGWRPKIMARLCARALEDGIEVEYVHGLIRKRNLVAHASPLMTELWPWPVKIRTFGGFQVFVHDQPVQFERKAQRRPLALLKALIALGGSDVRTDYLADELWPDSDGDAAEQALATTLHRLRKLLGQGDPLILRDGMLTLNRRTCWVDAWCFDEFINAAGSCKTNHSLTLRQNALRLYQGTFLPANEEEPLTDAMRNRLRGKFSQCVLLLCERWDQDKKHELSVSCLQAALRLESQVELFYEQLTVNLQRLGRQSEAIAVYHQYCENLSEQDVCSPSVNMQRLHEQLLGT